MRSKNRGMIFHGELRIPVLIQLIAESQGANYAKGLSKLAAEIQEKTQDCPDPCRVEGLSQNSDAEFWMYFQVMNSTFFVSAFLPQNVGPGH